MYVYSTYLHVIGVIIKKRPVFVLDLKAPGNMASGFYGTVNDTGTIKAKWFFLI